MIAIFDPGIGNLQSVRSGLLRAGTQTVVIDQAKAWDEALLAGPDVIEGVILPGVGAFGDAMFQLRAAGLIPIIRQIAREGRPLLGICLGMQLLFGQSTEHGRHLGIGLLPGEVVRFKGDVKVPHMGWNAFDVVHSQHPLLRGIKQGDYVYFVHSYYVQTERANDVLASVTYGTVQVPAVVGRNRVMGAQFHPEKSSVVGEQILRNFVQLCASWKSSQEVART